MSAAGATGAAEPPAEKPSLKRLFGNATIYGVGQFLVSVIGMIADPLLSYLLTRADFGLLGLTRSVSNLLANVYRLGLDGAANRFYYEVEHDPVARRRVVGTLNTFLLAWLLLLTAAQEIFGPAVYRRLFDDVPYAPYGRFVAYALLCNGFVAVAQTIWAAQERARRLVGLRIATALLTNAAMFGLLLTTHLGVRSVYWAQVLAPTAMLYVHLRFAWGTFGFAWEPRVLGRALAFSLPMVVHLGSHWALDTADRLLLDRYLGREAVGLYTVAYGTTSTLLQVNGAINGAYVPQFIRALSQGERAFVARAITYFLGAAAAAALGFLALGPTLIRAVYAARFAPAAALVPPLALGAFFHALYLIYVNGLFQAKRTTFIPVYTALAGAVNIGLNLWWIPRMGAMGAAWATLAGYAALFLLFRFGCNRVMRLPFERGRLARALGAAAVAAAVAWILDGRFPLWVELPAKLAAVLLAPILLVATGFLTHEERMWISDRLARIRRRLPGASSKGAA